MTKMKDDQTFRYKDGVASHNWIAHLVDSHSDAIQKQVGIYLLGPFLTYLMFFFKGFEAIVQL